MNRLLQELFYNIGNTNISIPDSVTEVGLRAFSSNEQTKSIKEFYRANTYVTDGWLTDIEFTGSSSQVPMLQNLDNIIGIAHNIGQQLVISRGYSFSTSGAGSWCTV